MDRRRIRPRRRRSFGELLAAAAVLASCASTTAPGPKQPRPRQSLVVVPAGDPDLRGRLSAALRSLRSFPFDLRLENLPNRPPAPAEADGDLDHRLSEARRHYVRADFGPCLSALYEPTLAPALLGDGRREAAARLLFWRIACLVGDGETNEAQRAAAEFAAFGLDVPPDVEAASPDVEAILATARRRAAAAERLSLEVVARKDALVSVDGRESLCRAPCTLDLVPGDHLVRVEADGAAPAIRVVRLARGRTRAVFRLDPATPEEAAMQWTARYGGPGLADSTAGIRLLAKAVASRRVVLLTVERQAAGALLRGALAMDGEVAARAARHTDDPAGVAVAVEPLLRELLVTGKLVEPPPPLYTRPRFWLAIGAAVAVTGAGAILLLRDPPRRTIVEF